jgi:parallel beta-helix repeat protein
MKKRTITSGKRFVVGSALLLLFTLSASHAFGEFYVIAGSRGVGTKIASLPYTINSPGFYYITKDLSVAGSDGITISADHVTLDLMGFSLIGSGGGTYEGIYMNGRSNVEIRNGTVRNFPGIGIGETGSLATGHRILNIRARDNGGSGIYLYGTSHTVKGCTAVGNGTNGIFAGTGSTITGNTCYQNDGDGIHAGTGSTITGNTCYDNGLDGIYAGIGSTVTGNTCYDNTDYGIWLNGHNLVDQNTAYDNDDYDRNKCPTCTFGTNHAPSVPL